MARSFGAAGRSECAQAAWRLSAVPQGFCWGDAAAIKAGRALGARLGAPLTIT